MLGLIQGKQRFLVSDDRVIQMKLSHVPTGLECG